MYNVAGLWDKISGSNPKKNTPLISERINRFDICLFQEDFNYHSRLLSHDHHKYRSPHKDINGWASGIGDGLSRFSKYPFRDFRREKWQHCSGIIDDMFDCDTPKGFTFARHILTDDSIVDIYNLHNDAGSSFKDEKVRKKNIKQLINRINQWSQGHAVIIAGDTNKRSIREGGLQQLLDAGFKDAWTEKCNKKGTQKLSRENVDKVLFRSGKAVQLNVDDADILKKEFYYEGKPLSDHSPWEFTFNYQQSSQIRLSQPYGGETNIKSFFNDLVYINKKTKAKSFTLRKTDNHLTQLGFSYQHDISHLHGSKSNVGELLKLPISTHDYVKRIKLCQSPEKNIHYVKIFTHLNGTLEGGKPTKECKIFTSKDGWQIIGLYGATDFEKIINAGIIYAKL